MSFPPIATRLTAQISSAPCPGLHRFAFAVTPLGVSIYISPELCVANEIDQEDIGKDAVIMASAPDKPGGHAKALSVHFLEDEDHDLIESLRLRVAQLEAEVAGV